MSSIKAESLGGVALGISQGVERAKLDWSIGGTAPLPNVISELKWQDLRIYKTQIDSEIWFENSLVVSASLSKGRVVSGSVRDSDYAQNDRQAEYSRSISKASGNTKSSSVSLGSRRLYLQPRSGRVMSLTPKIGYQFNQQNLTVTDGKQIISGIGNVLNPQTKISGLDSSYQSNWRGPWLGLEYRAHGETQQLIAVLKLHRMRYKGLGNWNLRDDFQHPISFEHTAKARGVSLDIDYERRVAKNIWAQLKLSYQSFVTSTGNDTTFFADGSVKTIDLKESSWQSLGLQLGAVVRF